MPLSHAEHEPTADAAPLPVCLAVGALALAIWGGWYLGTHAARFEPHTYDAEVPGQSTTAPPVASATLPSAAGKRVYQLCAACHQADGRGIPGFYPPLAGSPHVLGAPDIPIRITLHGMRGPLQVEGQCFDGIMPAWRDLGDERIAAVLTYIRSAWEQPAPAVTAADVAAVRRAASGRRRMWTLPELLAGTAPPPGDAEGLRGAGP